jgi:hypothetical protein
MNYYVHNVPGRLRVKIPDIKGNESNYLKIKDLLSQYDEINRISINPVTGSVVVHYNEDKLQPWEILFSLKESGYLKGPITIPNHDKGPKTGAGAGEAVWKAVFGWAVGKAFEGSGLSILAAFI